MPPPCDTSCTHLPSHCPPPPPHAQMLKVQLSINPPMGSPRPLRAAHPATAQGLGGLRGTLPGR